MIPNLFDKKEIIISNADNALYEAKKTGRNRVVAHGKISDQNGDGSVWAKDIVTKRPLLVKLATLLSSLEGEDNENELGVFAQRSLLTLKEGSLRGKGPLRP